MPQPNDTLVRLPQLLQLESRIRQVYQKEFASYETSLLLEQLPYSLEACVSAMLALTKAQEEAVAYAVDQHKGKKTGTAYYQLPAPLRLDMAFAVDSYLDAACRAHNSSWIYLSKVLRISAPYSLSKLVTGIKAGGIVVPGRLRDLVLTYWRDAGRSIKAYRDLNQHHAVVSSEGHGVVLSDGSGAVRLGLPSDPYEKSLSKWRYGDPYIHASLFVFESFDRLFSFLFELTHVLLSYTQGGDEVILDMGYKGPLTLGANARLDVTRAPAVSTIKDAIIRLQASLLARLEKELPRRDITPTLVAPADGGIFGPFDTDAG